MEYVDQALGYLRDGFANINNPRGLLIALVAVIFMGSWRQWLPLAAVATVFHIIIGQLAPVLGNGHGSLTLPPDLMEQGFWVRAGVLLLGYLIVIGVFFFVKSMLFKGGSAKAAH
ncbi:MAG TPA: hypothetical protein VG943_02730 [Caulobacterales bacterium]|nr:hypothetical protein [Caulobacterales bacterium]